MKTHSRKKSAWFPRLNLSLVRSAVSLLLLSLPFISVSAFAKSGEEHVADMIGAIFGDSSQANPAARDLARFISQGMDYGGGAKPVSFSEPGSSFYETVRQKFPKFTGKHREFAHWGSRGGIPRTTLEAFEKVYPGQRQALIDTWHEYVFSRQEYVRQALGLGTDATSTRMARAAYSLFEDVHLLGDWTTSDTEGLLKLKTINADIQRSLDDLVGASRSREIMTKVKEATKGFREDQFALRAQKSIDVIRSSDLPKSIASNLERVGYDGTIRTVNPSSLKKSINSFLKDRAALRAAPTRIKMPRSVRVSSPAKAGKVLVGGAKGATRGVAAAGKTAGAASSGWLAKAMDVLGPVAVIATAVDFGYEEWKNYDQYDKKQISRAERDRKTSSHVGATVGGLAGAYAGSKMASSHYDNSGGGGGVGAGLFILAAGLIGAAVGSWLGDEAGGTTYDWVAKTPYEQVCEDKWHNDSDAQYFAGLYKYEGRFTYEDQEKAVEHWSWAALIGDNRSALRLGECYYHGDGAAVSKSDAVFYWLLGALRGDALSAYYVGLCYLRGDGVVQNDYDGLTYLKRAASLGNEDAKVVLAEILDQAIKGAEEGDSSSMKILGNFCDLGFDEFDIPYDREKAVMWYEKAAGLGDSNAQLNFANYLESTGMPDDHTEARQWYELAAKQGNSLAEALLGHVFENEGEYSSAINLYERAIQDGNGLAAQHLARLYAEGVGVERNQKKAFDLYSLAATTDPTLFYAHIQLGKMLYWGTGCSVDREEATRHFLLAGWLGDKEARDMIGYLYHIGDVLPQNTSLGDGWYKSANSRLVTKNNHVAKTGTSSRFSIKDPKVSIRSASKNVKISVACSRIDNDGDTRSGDLWCFLWNAEEPYQGGSIKGKQLGGVSLGSQVKAGYGYPNKQLDFLIANEAFHGFAQLVLTVNEYHEDEKWYTVGWSNLALPSQDIPEAEAIREYVKNIERCDLAAIYRSLPSRYQKDLQIALQQISQNLDSEMWAASRKCGIQIAATLVKQANVLLEEDAEAKIPLAVHGGAKLAGVFQGSTLDDLKSGDIEKMLSNRSLTMTGKTDTTPQLSCPILCFNPPTSDEVSALVGGAYDGTLTMKRVEGVYVDEDLVEFFEELEPKIAAKELVFKLSAEKRTNVLNFINLASAAAQRAGTAETKDAILAEFGLLCLFVGALNN